MIRIIALLVLSTLSCAAYVDETIDQCEQEWGTAANKNADGSGASFFSNHTSIAVWAKNGKIYQVGYDRVTRDFTQDEINELLKENSGGFTWKRNGDYWNIAADATHPSRMGYWSPQYRFLFTVSVDQPPDSTATSTPPSPTDPAACLKKANELNENNDFKGALEWFDKAIVLDPQNSEALQARAEDKTDLGDFKGALDDYNKAIILKPQDWWGYYHRANCEDSQGDWAAAADDCAKALQYVGSDVGDQALLLDEHGSDRYSQGDLSSATQDFNHALERNPKDTSAFFSRGLVENAEGKFDDAASDFAQAASLGDDIAPLLWWDAEVEGHHRNQADAGVIQLLQKAGNGTADPWRLELANLLLGKTSVQQVQTDAGSTGKSLMASYFIGIALAQAGDKAGSQQAFQQMISQCRAGTPLRLEAIRHLNQLNQ